LKEKSMVKCFKKFQILEENDTVPDLVVIGRLNHIKQFYEYGLGIKYDSRVEKLYNKWYVENTLTKKLYIRSNLDS